MNLRRAFVALLGTGIMTPVVAQTSQVFLFNLTTPVAGLSDPCVAILNQAINCHPNITLFGLGGGDAFVDTTTVTNLCTTTCTNAITTHLRRINQTCVATTRFNYFGINMLVGYYAQILQERYNALCLKNSGGQFCQPLLSSAFESFYSTAISTVTTTTTGAGTTATATNTVLPTTIRM